MELKIYLAGGMNKANWQGKVIDQLLDKGFSFFNPKEHDLTDSKEYTLWDLFYVQKADILFACMEFQNPSGFGLTLEVGYAKALGKPIILVDEKSSRDPDFAHRFKIVREASSIVFQDLESGVDFLQKLKNGVVSF